MTSTTEINNMSQKEQGRRDKIAFAINDAVKRYYDALLYPSKLPADDPYTNSLYTELHSTFYRIAARLQEMNGAGGDLPRLEDYDRDFIMDSCMVMHHVVHDLISHLDDFLDRQQKAQREAAINTSLAIVLNASPELVSAIRAIVRHEMANYWGTE
jgi:hypothetical protein